MAQGLPAEPPGTFSEKLTVRERETLVELPDNLADVRFEPRDFRVLVDGQLREVTRVEPATGEWTIILYVDRALAKPGTIFYSGLALARHTHELTQAGSIEIVVADSDPRVALPPTREAKRIERTLVDLSSAARIERDRMEGLLPATREPAVPQLRRQLDKLLIFLAARRPAGPHAVFVVADGPDLSPEQAALLERQDLSGPATPAAAMIHRYARLLAAYGWVTIPVPLRKEGVGIGVAPKSEIKIFRETSAPSDHQNGVPPILPGRSPKKTTLALTGVIDLFIEPETAALRLLARATAGTVIGFEEQIGPTLTALSRRWRLWMSEPDAPVDGRLHALEVSLTDRMRVDVMAYPVAMGLPNKTKTVRAPEWIRSSIPEEIAETRLEAFLAGRPAADGDLSFTGSVWWTPSGLELRLEVAPLRTPASASSGPLRVSWAFSGEEGATGIGHEILPGEGLEEGTRHAVLIVPPPGARRIAVVVEALGPESWGGAVLEMPAGGP